MTTQDLLITGGDRATRAEYLCNRISSRYRDRTWCRGKGGAKQQAAASFTLIRQVTFHPEGTNLDKILTEPRQQRLF